jgi:hypothetical protein
MAEEATSSVQSQDKESTPPTTTTTIVISSKPTTTTKPEQAEVDEWGLPVKSPTSDKPTSPTPTPSTPSPPAESAPPNSKHVEPESQTAPESNADRPLTPPPPEPTELTEPTPSTTSSPVRPRSNSQSVPKISEWSHQQVMTGPDTVPETEDEQWQEMPAFAPFDIYNDHGKLVAREETEEENPDPVGNKGGATKGYTRVLMDEDAQSATSMDDNTAYLFKGQQSNVLDEDDDEGRDMASQMQTTKTLLTEGQRIAYVGIVRLAIIEMTNTFSEFNRSRSTKKALDHALEGMTMWGQMIMLRMYAHIEIASAEQVMIEQLSEHGVKPTDLTPSLMQNARIKNPMKDEDPDATKVDEQSPAASTTNLSVQSPMASSTSLNVPSPSLRPSIDSRLTTGSPGLYDDPDYIDEKQKLKSPLQSPTDPRSPNDSDKDGDENEDDDLNFLSDIADKKSLEIDIRWTVLCDLFLIMISDSNYDSRSRTLLELVGSYLEIEWMDICRFEKRITEALEVQENADKEDWNEDEHMEKRRKGALRKRYMVMGMATVGGGLIIGLSMGLLAPVIGAGLAAGFTTFGITGTGSFLAGAGGAAIITTTGVMTGSNIGFKAGNNRTGAVQTFEYRPLHNNKRPNLIVTIAGWLTGSVDDVRLPFSTVDPIMGDIYSVFWEPEMLKSMGDTINILATEALTQALQQILGSTILTALMAAIQLPIVLTKLAYLIDNPWTVSLARADLAGLILADSLIDRNLGSRPITLVGFSLGARVISAALRELTKKGQIGIVQNVYIFGTPVVVNTDEFTRIRSIVPGRFVNAYTTNDWILGLSFIIFHF